MSSYNKTYENPSCPSWAACLVSFHKRAGQTQENVSLSVDQVTLFKFRIYSVRKLDTRKKATSILFCQHSPTPAF